MNGLQEIASFDGMLNALSNVQRRKLLVALLEHNPQEVSPVVIIDDDSEQTAHEQIVEMNHVHLPKLADYGFIEWDRENEKVSKGPAFDEIRPLVELLDNHQGELPGDWI